MSASACMHTDHSFQFQTITHMVAWVLQDGGCLESISGMAAKIAVGLPKTLAFLLPLFFLPFLLPPRKASSPSASGAAAASSSAAGALPSADAGAACSVQASIL